MDNNGKKLVLGGLVALVFLLVVGFAAFGSQLTIKGTARVSTAWDVHISSVVANKFVGSAQNVSSTIEESGLAATLETDLKAPGDSVTYDVTVVNEGSINAKLSDINFHQSQAQEAADVEGYKPSITYAYTGIDTQSEDTKTKLKPGESVTFQVTVTFTKDFDTKTFTEAQIENQLELVLTYVQDTTA